MLDYYYPSRDLDVRHVQVLIQFLRIGEIDTMNEKYHAEIRIESKWIEYEDIVEYDPKNYKYWNPKLYIENALEDTKQQITYDVQLENDKFIVTELRIVKGVFWERLELQNFPMDIQELSVTVTTKRSPNEIKLESDPVRMSCIDMNTSNTFIDQQKWELFKLVKISETASYDESTSENSRKLVKPPKIVATCFCARKAGYYFMNAFFLIFLITSSALTIFSVDCKLPQSRLQITFTLLLTSISFKWVINRSLPTVSYLTSLDRYSIFGIFYLCMLCVWHSVVGRFWEKELADNLDCYSLIGFSLLLFLTHLLVFLWVYIAYSKHRELKREEKEFLIKFKNNYARQQQTVFKEFFA